MNSPQDNTSRSALVARLPDGSYTGSLAGEGITHRTVTGRLLQVANQRAFGLSLVKKENAINRSSLERILSAFKQMNCGQVFLHLGNYWRVYEFGETEEDEPRFRLLEAALEDWCSDWSPSCRQAMGRIDRKTEAA